MRNFFNLESPLMVFLSDLTDVVLLNVICLICCIPIVTIGPSLTAMHYVTLKMVKDEEGNVIKRYFKSFKENFKQSFIVGIVFLIISLIFYLDYKILKSAGLEENKIFVIVIASIYLFVCFTVMYIFPLLSRFENTLKQTVKNAIFMSILHIFKTIPMAIIYAIPLIIAPLHYNLLLVFILVGLSGPAYINSFIWNSIFKKYEPQEVKEECIVPDEEFQIPEE